MECGQKFSEFRIPVIQAYKRFKSRFPKYDFRLKQKVCPNRPAYILRDLGF